MGLGLPLEPEPRIFGLVTAYFISSFGVREEGDVNILHVYHGS